MQKWRKGSKQSCEIEMQHKPALGDQFDIDNELNYTVQYEKLIRWELASNYTEHLASFS